MRAIAVTCNGTEYYYVRNAQGDIVKLIDSTGATVVEYTYDSWGKLLSTTGSLATTLGSDQPFRYRGYVYDTETSLYYLQTRYYDPSTCRFLSADVVLSTGQGVLGHNAYAYCGNNPTSRVDSGGFFWEELSEYWQQFLLAIQQAIASAKYAYGTVALLPIADGMFPVGDFIAFAGVVLITLRCVGHGIKSIVNYAKKSKQSNKERSTDKPSWLSPDDVDLSRSAQENARRLLNDKYGNGNWKPGASKEFNKIVKWINRSLKAVLGFTKIFGSEDEE